jgi:WD40 repeat protein
MGANCSNESNDGKDVHLYGASDIEKVEKDVHNDRNPVHKGPIMDIEWSERHKCVISCSDDKMLSIVDWKKERQARDRGVDIERAYLKGHGKAVNRLHVNRTSGSLWSVSRDLSLRSWDIESKSMVTNIPDTHDFNVSAVTSSREGDTVFTGSRDYHVKGWDVETSKNVNNFSVPRNIVTAMQCGVDSDLVYQASEDLCIRVWDPRASFTSSKPALHIPGFVYFALCLDLHSDGKSMVTGCKGFNGVGCEVKLWDLRKLAKPVTEYRGHEQDVTSCRFIGGSRIVSCSKDGWLRMWDSGDTSKQDEVASYNAGCKFTSLCMSEEDTAGTSVFAAGSFEGGITLMQYRGTADNVEISCSLEL